MNIQDFATGLELIDGVWYSSNVSEVSYPDDGNEKYYQVEATSFWFRHRNDCILQVMHKFPPRGPLFDVGGGNGFVSKAIENRGYEVVLVEPGRNGVINAKKRKVKNIVCATLEDIQVKKSSIPAVGVFDVVEHLPNDLSFLNMLYELLENDGKLYLTVPAYNFLWSHEDVEAGHFNRYTIQSISRKLEKLNFSILYSTYFFSPLPLPIFLLRSIPTLISTKTKLNKNSRRIGNDHSKGYGFLRKVWSWELKKIGRLEKIPFGSSCLLVATKSV